MTIENGSFFQDSGPEHEHDYGHGSSEYYEDRRLNAEWFLRRERIMEDFLRAEKLEIKASDLYEDIERRSMRQKHVFEHGEVPVQPDLGIYGIMRFQPLRRFRAWWLEKDSDQLRKLAADDLAELVIESVGVLPKLSD